MSDQDQQSEALRQLWRENDQENEDVAMLMELLLEKRQSFKELVREQSSGEYLFTLSFAAIAAVFAWIASAPIFQIGYGFLAVTLTVAAIVTWWFARKTRDAPAPELSLRDHHLSLVALYDRRIRYLRGVKYWYTGMLISAGIVLYPLATDVMPNPWGPLALITVLLAAWVAVWHRCDVRGVAQIDAKKGQVHDLLRRLEPQ